MISKRLIIFFIVLLLLSLFIYSFYHTQQLVTIYEPIENENNRYARTSKYNIPISSTKPHNISNLAIQQAYANKYNPIGR